MSLNEESIYEALSDVVDPELGLDIVSLGLVYDTRLDPDNGAVRVIFTLTTPACPVGELIETQIRDYVGDVDGITKVDTELVWSPTWSPEMMSEDAKFALGF